MTAAGELAERVSVCARRVRFWGCSARVTTATKRHDQRARPGPVPPAEPGLYDGNMSAEMSSEIGLWAM